MLTNTTEIESAIPPLRSLTIPALTDVSPSAQRLGRHPRLTAPPDPARSAHPGSQTSHLRSGGAGKTDEPRPRRCAFVRARRRIASGVAPWRRDAPPDRAASPGRDAARDNVMDDSRNAWQQARAVNAMIGAQRPAPHLTHLPGNEPLAAPPPTHRKPLRLAAPALLALLAALAAAPAAAQTTVTLVSNIGQARHNASALPTVASPSRPGPTRPATRSPASTSSPSIPMAIRSQSALHDQRQRPSRHAHGQPHRARHRLHRRERSPSRRPPAPPSQPARSTPCGPRLRRATT